MNNEMKKSNIPQYFLCLACAAAMLLWGSCKKDTLDSSDLLIYVAGDYASTTNTVTTPFLHTPAGVSGDSVIRVAASATRDVVAAVDVTFTADTTLVAQYNQVNKTNCIALPANTYNIVNPGKHTIAVGALTSDSLEVDITDPASLTNPGGYLLPLTITAITGKDKGVRISTNKKTVFINVTYSYTNIFVSQTPTAAALLARTGWSVTVSNTTSGSLGPAMLDGSNSTAWRSSNSSAAAKYAIVNIAAIQTISGLQLIPDYVSTGDNPTQIKVSTSTDSTTWTVQGIWTGTGPATGTNAANPDKKGINFIAPVQAKYFRFDITAWVSGSRTGIGEVYATQ
ncbi:BT_3987 domain-containing protein [Puia sp.]|uniref:BT_3987 domain-containing protein n=1 Tax=Puia sp. TaxID=2045100 RepID=UPI002F42D975